MDETYGESRKVNSVFTRYKNVIEAQTYDQKRFNSLSGKISNALELRNIKRLMRIIELEGSLEKVIDIPCGTGRITKLLLDMGYQVVGADSSKEFIQVAKRKLNNYIQKNQIVFQVSDARSTEFKDNQFDCITSIRFFHHLKQDEKKSILKELARISKKYIIINIAYTSSIYSIRNNIKNYQKKLKGERLQKVFSNEREIRDLFLEAGLTEVKRTYVFPFVSENLLFLLAKKQ